MAITLPEALQLVRQAAAENAASHNAMQNFMVNELPGFVTQKVEAAVRKALDNQQLSAEAEAQLHEDLASIGTEALESFEALNVAQQAVAPETQPDG